MLGIGPESPDAKLIQKIKPTQGAKTKLINSPQKRLGAAKKIVKKHTSIEGILKRAQQEEALQAMPLQGIADNMVMHHASSVPMQ
mmetsp:Transcript_29494/g.44815  ORF Transcript_29494/g.44815 Transcript_29494/m.44815 type:complete len:85 (+) Transcript_29494:4697-4951(+)